MSVLTYTLLSTCSALAVRETEFLSVGRPADDAMGPNLNFAPLSTTMKCTINLTLQYMVIFTALGMCRTYLDFTGVPHKQSEVQKALKHASETVFYAPMACLMFVGFRMRVLQLTKGTGNPQEWVQDAMQWVAWSILANTVLVLLVPIFTAKPVAIDETTGDVKTDAPNPFENQVLAILFTVLRYMTFLGLYVGFGTVSVGLYMYEPPAGIWQGAVPAVSPAVGCTCLLANTFFAVYCLVAVSRTYSQFNPAKAGEDEVSGTTTFEQVMVRAADTLGMAPMLSVLFLAARMRALQMDPLAGNPQGWAQACFYTCTYALVAQCLVSVFVPLVLKGSATPSDKVEGDVKYEVGISWLATGLTVFRYVIMLCVYAGATAVVCSVFTIEHPQGAHLTPSISPTMLCVINLSFQYFFIYLLVWVCHTVQDFAGEVWFINAVQEAVESAKGTVQFAPMLSVLFIATRMRALQITDNKGAPQGYVQQGMYLASWAVMVQFLMCLTMPLFTRKTYHADSLDTPTKDKEPVKNYWGAVTVSVIRYTALASLLGGVATVITGVFLMTPANATGAGSMPLVGDYVSAPYQPTDIHGVKGAMEGTGKTIGAGVETTNSATNAINPVA